MFLVHAHHSLSPVYPLQFDPSNHSNQSSKHSALQPVSRMRCTFINGNVNFTTPKNGKRRERIKQLQPQFQCNMSVQQKGAGLKFQLAFGHQGHPPVTLQGRFSFKLNLPPEVYCLRQSWQRYLRPLSRVIVWVQCRLGCRPEPETTTRTPAVHRNAMDTFGFSSFI